MSTRSLTVFTDYTFGEPYEVVVMYRHCDGYPEVHGKELVEFLLPFGIAHCKKDGCFNGVGELAAAVVAHFRKNEVSLFPSGTRNISEYYTYEVDVIDHCIIIKIYGIDGLIYGGTPKEVYNFLCLKHTQ